jgi:hypothetical protein
VEIFIEFSQESSRWAKIQNPDIVRSYRTLSDQRFLGRILNLGAHWRDAGHCPAPDNVRLEVSILEVLKKDLAWLFSLHPHTSLNSTVFLYSRNIKENFIETPLKLLQRPFNWIDTNLGSLFPFLLFDCLNSCLILIETIRFLFGLFSITEIK